MGFADAYLLKAGLRDKLIETDPFPDLKIIVTLPVYNESGLERCLDSLFLCETSSGIRAEVLILINAPADAPAEIHDQNQSTLDQTRTWIADHPHPQIRFFAHLDHSFSRKESGVGTARKILMDEASRRFNQINNPNGIIASLDADALVEPNYLKALSNHFESTGAEGCSLYYEHPLEEAQNSGQSEYSVDVYEAVAQYELHLRYYVQSVRYTGYPYAFHTVGSSFAVKADVYCLEGGMNRKQGGEDFYFIQKITQRGSYNDCMTTRIIPSPRPSDRVPFGTGPVISKFIQTGEPMTTYHPESFRILKALFSQTRQFYDSDPDLSHVGSLNETQTDLLKDFLDAQQFGAALAEIRKNSASYPAFVKRFWRWFNMFRIMKFLHFARERGYPDVPVGDAASDLITNKRPSIAACEHPGKDIRQLLECYRKWDRQGIKT